jgi:PAS domain S-box-containing protein
MGKKPLTFMIRWIAKISGVTVLYYLVGWLGFFITLPPGNNTILWLPSGLALAAVVIWGWPTGLGIFAGALLIHWDRINGPAALPVTVIIAIGATLQAWAGAWLLKRFIKTLPPTTVHATLLTLIITVLTTLLAPALAITSLCAAEYEPWGNYYTLFEMGWLGNLIGILILAPLLITLYIHYEHKQKVKEPFLWSLTGFIIGLTLFTFITLQNTRQGPMMGAGLQQRAIHWGQWVEWVILTSGLLLAGGFLAYVNTRQKMEDTLRQRENEYRLISENTGDMIWILDLESHHFTYISPSVEKLRGYTPQEMMNQSMREALTPDSFQKMMASIPDRLAIFEQNHLPITYRDELDQFKKDGSIIHTEVTTTFAMNSTGKIQVVGISRDITERKQAAILQEAVYRIADAVHTSESLQDLYAQIHRHISGVMDASNFYIALYDKTKNLMQFVYSVDEIDVRSSEPFTPHKGLTVYVIQTGKSLLFSEDREEYGFEVIGTPSKVWLGVPLIVHNRTIGVMAVQHYSDIHAYTEREQRILEFVSSQVATAIDLKQTEEAVRLIEKRNNAIIENAPDGIILIDVAGMFKFASPSAYRIFGYSSDEIIGYDPVPKTHPEDFPRVLELLQDLLDHPEKVCTLEYRFQHKNGTYRWIESTFSNLIQDPSVNAIVINFRDITERKQADEQLQKSRANLEALNRDLEKRVEERTAEVRQSEAILRDSRDQLSAANAALEKASRLKDEFLASMSHELRTPLTGILGLSEALQLQVYGSLTEKQLNALKNIESSGRHLLDLINDILDLSKIEAGKLEMQFVPCSVMDICQASLQLVKGMANQKKQSVSFSMTPSAIMLRADARRLKQMLVNLLSNAVKFTPEGGALGLEVQAIPPEQIISFKIWDNGIGIKPEAMDKLFKPFVQLDSSLARQYSGTGLGLSLVQRMAELHGGSIRLESAPGEGSRFTIILPWQEDGTKADPGLENDPVENGGTSEALAVRADLLSPDPPRVLVADDNEVILEMVTGFLETSGYRVSAARNGVELLERAAQLHPDIILMDIQMPGMDGMETLRRLRTHSDPVIAATPVIAITALVMSGDREKCLQSGANEYISKPIILAQLVKQINHFIGI